jgi:hypothetical protein
MLSRQNEIHRWNTILLSFQSISVENVNFVDACVQLAETLGFGICCMVDTQTPHFAILKTHDKKI